MKPPPPGITRPFRRVIRASFCKLSRKILPLSAAAEGKSASLALAKAGFSPPLNLAYAKTS